MIGCCNIRMGAVVYVSVVTCPLSVQSCELEAALC